MWAKHYMELHSSVKFSQWVKNPPANAGDARGTLNPWVGRSPGERKWQPHPGFLPGGSHGQKSLEGYIVHGVAELATTEHMAQGTIWSSFILECSQLYILKV